MKAEELLTAALAMLKERGCGYDEGRERSMSRAVVTFAGDTGNLITVADGWRFMQAVKRARLASSPGHTDSAVDLVAYVALEMEAVMAPHGPTAWVDWPSDTETPTMGAAGWDPQP